MDLYFIRHGQSTGNRDRRVQSATTPLTERGQAQAEQTGRWLATYFATQGRAPAALYSSDLQRAWETAQRIGAHLGLTPQPEPGVREKHGGEAEGYLVAEMAERYPELLAGWGDYTNMDWGWPGGETRRVMQERANAALDRITARHAPDDALLIVTHGGPLWAYLNSRVLGTPPDLTETSAHLANCSITHVHLPVGADDAPGAACLLTLNEVGHLADAEA